MDKAQQVDSTRSVRGGLEIIQVDGDTYTAHAEGIGAVYWIGRSDHWGGKWQAFTTRKGAITPQPDRPVHRPRTRRADVFEAVRAYWNLSDRRNPTIHTEDWPREDVHHG